MPDSASCCLCSQIQGDPSNDLIAGLLPGEPYARRVLFETGSFAVIPSLGPLADGHVLLCPKPHVRSFAQVGEAMHAEYEALKRTLRTFLGATFDADVHLFEHGVSADGKRRVCTVDHAHMHFVPLPSTLPTEPCSGREWTAFDGSLRSLADLSQGREYVFYETATGVSRVLLAGHREVESQYMRRVLAEGLGKGGTWNWRDAPDPRAAHETWRRCCAAAGRATLAFAPIA